MKNKIHKKVDPRTTAAKEGYIHTVRLPWHSHHAMNDWNETCASIIEIFGLPGDRFLTHATTDHMDFMFKSPKDLNLCKILISEKIS